MSLIQSDCCPFKKRKLDAQSETKNVCEQTKYHVRAQQKSGHQQGKDRGSEEARPADTLVLD